jgi:hypothetical protein
MSTQAEVTLNRAGSLDPDVPLICKASSKNETAKPRYATPKRLATAQIIQNARRDSSSAATANARRIPTSIVAEETPAIAPIENLHSGTLVWNGKAVATISPTDKNTSRNASEYAGPRIRRIEGN